LPRTGKTVRFAIPIIAAVVIFVSAVLYLIRPNHCVLFYYGASPQDVPQGTAIAVLNPLRNRKDERNAEWLIRDLRTNQCERISRERLNADPVRICSTLRGNTKANLVWLDPESDTIRGGTRTLVYDLPDKRARLVVYFGADEDGWGVTTADIVQ